MKLQRDYELGEPFYRQQVEGTRRSSRSTHGLWIHALWLVPILALAAIARFYGLTQTAIWCDEGSSLLMSQYSPALTWFHSAHDVHPPLYYLLLHAWMNVFGNGIFSIRAMSALPGIATVGLAVWLMRLITTPRAAVLGGVLLALMPIVVRYSQEVRMYSLMGFWLMGATVALVYWVKNPSRKRYLAIYALLMTASFYTHYFTCLCVLAHWFYLLMLRCKSEDKLKLITRPAWWVTNVAIIVLYAPWIPSLVGQLTHLDQLRVGGDVGWIPPITLDSLPSAIWQFLTLKDGGDVWFPLYLLMPLAIATIAVMVVVRDRSDYRFNGLLVAYTFLPLLVIFAVSFVTPLLVERYLMFAAIGLPLVLAVAIDQLERRFRFLAIGLLVGVLGIEMVGLKNNYSVDNEQFDVLVNYVNQNYVAGDRIVVSDLFWYFGYVYYNKTGAQPLLYTPTLPDGTSGRPNAYGFGTLVDEDADKIYVDRLQVMPKGTGRVWLVSGSYQPDDFRSIPSEWNKETELKVGDTEVRLYTIH
ncbi:MULTISPECIES: glycosyltransferase family 39 protein [unclassified Pseudomonas]|uniref:glycosyltransferase family 39 protein n=1 Tax=unclassified Pseudomonas TaxID=196821 RepID=UPI002AC8EC46|nr:MULTISPECIES: glycosyltransferase family 39 protein [unclassified Pseudomonas]MEB0039262.1 glycosyltransferase family 39 protein [Pseudomonas sp. MH10]MEB0076087.1 glycosyltransferase family 39 protein [Pseudomonas sp. MH10out]MEB0090806.1 glycosyltransferase family 39 protein [Pseudomonas sp. CCI4.2]MEB0100112.1 glycosyltransferase family 39 protein [Pseudomonas sp. CCI3.2]MEB0119701.1 glycosyltransferase family 39 protein [Pseudomonas sp. CCI1.2]